MGVADSSVVIIRAICFLGEVLVNIVVVVALLDSRGLFRTLLRILCAFDVCCVIFIVVFANELQILN